MSIQQEKSSAQSCFASQQEPATKIRLVHEETASAQAAAVYQYFRDQMCRPNVPPILKCFAFDPAFARTMIDLSGVLLFRDGFLSRRQKELIATYISSLNACPYCFDSHGAFLIACGVPRQAVDHLANNDLSDLSTAEEQLLIYLGKVEQQASHTTHEDVQRLRGLGWQEEQIAEAVHVAAMMGFCNRIANAFGLPTQNALATGFR
jgi:uncharacterized peroxidase-related enzyme